MLMPAQVIAVMSTYLGNLLVILARSLRILEGNFSGKFLEKTDRSELTE